MTVKFELGERKHVRLIVSSCKGDDFEITLASYELRRQYTDEVEDSGTCVIAEHALDMMIAPQTAGKYWLHVTYHIADETLIDVVEVIVD